MTVTQYTGPLHSLAIMQAIKPDERIVCTNATVIMDSKGNISYFRNDTPVCLVNTEGEHEN